MISRLLARIRAPEYLGRTSLKLEFATANFIAFSSRRGAYRVLIQSTLSPADTVVCDLWLRPAPGAPLFPADSFRMSDGQLFTLTIPACAGFELHFANTAGRAGKTLDVFVWSL